MADKLTYKDAGVNIDAGNYSVKLIKDAVRATYRPEVLGDLGGFGGLFALKASQYKEPVLVSGTDGVGTKLRVAFMLNKHDTVGQDAVAMCVNDILVQGAEPLFFLDYLAVGQLDPEQVATVVKGVAAACKESGCALIGGETAEMSGFYPVGEYDIAGFAVGVVEKSKVITSERVQEGDVLLGLPSSGIHSNGYSLVRKICFERQGFDGSEYIAGLGKTIGEELLTPTRLYPKTCLPLIREFDIHGMVHITGGGFYDNIPRALPDDMSVVIDSSQWQMPTIFQLLQKWGNVEWPEMYRTFNMGIGMIIIASPDEADKIKAHLAAENETVYEIGRGEVQAEIAVVLSDKPDAYALERAKKAGIKAVCVNRKEYDGREPFERALIEELRAAGVTLVVLAGFMRILTPYFVREYAGRIMNIHPALLPSFPGAHAHRDVLAYGVKVSGCTVHFVDEGTDSGPIILQAAVPVLDDDTEETLGARVLEQEHKIYPRAIELYCEGRLHVEGRHVRIDE